MLRDQRFLSYFDQMEAFGLRSERFDEVVYAIINHPQPNTRLDVETLVNWLEASFLAGVEFEKNNK